MYKALVTKMIPSKGLERTDYYLEEGEEVKNMDSRTLVFCLDRDFIEKIEVKGESDENKQQAPANQNKQQGGNLDPDENGNYTEEQLKAMTMNDLRPIGAALDVKDNKKSELIGKILEAQIAKGSSSE